MMKDRLECRDELRIVKRRRSEMESSLRLGGRLTILKRRPGRPDEETEISLNTVNATGKENIIRQIAQITSGDFPIPLDDDAVLTARDTGDNPLVTRQTVDSAPTYGGAYFAQYIWTFGAGVGTGAWDDIIIEAYDGASAYKEMSEFLGKNSAWGTKAANEEWVVTYKLIAS